MRLIQFSLNPCTSQRICFIALGTPLESISLFLEDNNFDAQAANNSIKPEICMRQMTHETIFSCVSLQSNVSMVRKTQPWRNTVSTKCINRLEIYFLISKPKHIMR